MALSLLSPGCGSKHGAARQAADAELGQQASADGAGGDDPPLTNNDPSQDPFETADWDIVSFSDPRSNTLPAEAYDIIDGRVIIAFCDPPVLPVVDPNYFDTERPANDPVYSQVTSSYSTTTTSTGETMLNDPEIAAFIAAENLTVYAEWPMVAGLAAQLPEGQSVADAVANWPGEYPGLVEAVDPDAVGYPCAYPETDPNDDKFASQWAITESSNYDINIRRVQREHPQGRGSSSRVIAIIDTGVDYSLRDLQGRSALYGCNTGDKRASTQFLGRSQGGGEPWDWLQAWGRNNAERQNQAMIIGHGTCMAGACSAVINNENPRVPSPNDDCDIAGAADYPVYFPVAVKLQIGFSESAILNAFTAVGCVRGVYNKTAYYGANFFVPSYNIEVVNCSFTGRASTVGNRHLFNLSPYMLFVCAAGNDGSGVRSNWPANYDTAVSVAAYTSTGARWDDQFSGVGSNHHSTVDIAAPGDGIWTTDMRGTIGGYKLGFDTLNISDPGYTGVVANVSGTSISASYVSAVAVLIAGLPGSPSPAATKSRITLSHGILPGDLAFCGRLDAWGAMQ